MLLKCEGGGLAGGSTGHNPVHALGEKKLEVGTESFNIQISFCIVGKRSDNRWKNAFKHMYCHLPATMP